jgi:Tol biopolymer transport system component
VTAGRGTGTASRPPRRTTGDPYGMAAARPFLAPVASLAGLLLIGLMTIAVLTGNLPFLPSKAGANPNPGTGGTGPVPIVPGKTPSPSAPPVANPDVGIAGQLVYAKAGNLWIQHAAQVTQLTSTGRDSQPTWSTDGTWVYFIETRQTLTRFPRQGIPVAYALSYPILSRIHPDGTGREAILSGLYRTGGGRFGWSYFMRDPAVSPDGRTVAVASDGPDPTKSDVVIALVNIAKKKLSPLGLPEDAPFGHQDPAWSLDGKSLVYVRNARNGARGAPTIWRYDLGTKKNVPVSQPGYTEPQYSPDGRYLVATKTSTLGTDIVVLDARNGNELLRVTSDGRSWGGAWSPDGSQVAFLRLTGLTTDLQLATLASGAIGDLSVKKVDAVTGFSGLDAASRPAWWGPRPTPAAPASAPPSGSGIPSGSGAPSGSGTQASSPAPSGSGTP